MNSSNHITVMSFYAKHRRTGCYKIGSYSFAQLESSGHFVVLIQHIISLQKIYYKYIFFQICHILLQNWTSKKVWSNWWNTSMIYMKDWATWFVLNCFGFCGSVWNYLEWPWLFCLMIGPIWSLYLPLQSWFISVMPFIGIIWVEELRPKDESWLKNSTKNVITIFPAHFHKIGKRLGSNSNFEKKGMYIVIILYPIFNT